MDIKREADRKIQVDWQDMERRPAGRLFVIIWPLIAIVAVLFGLAGVSLDILSAARAYVGGESLWSKGQKDAVYFLERYARDDQTRDYQAFLDSIAVPLGDRVAREELDKSDPDLTLAARGFLAGRNDPRDVPSMIRLYRWFRLVGPMREAITIWAEADRNIARLSEVGHRLHEAVGVGDTGTIDRLLQQIDLINTALTPLEQHFSRKLGSISLQIRDALQGTLLVATVVLLTAGVQVSSRMLAYSQRYELALRRSEAMLREAQALAHVGNWSRDFRSGQSEWSPEALRLFGFDAGSAPQREQHLAAIDEEDRAAVAGRWEAALRSGEPYDIEYRLRSGGPPIRWVNERGRSRADRSGRIIELNGTVMDVTERKAAEDRIRQLAHYDEVTGLPNRTLLYQHLGHLLARCQRHGGRFALMFIDLDRFKEINDNYGHTAGDRALRETAHRIGGCLRGSDMIARYGGDEFIVVIESSPGDQDLALIGRKIRDAVSVPLSIAAAVHHVSASIGVSRYPENGSDLQILIRKADLAMYRAKESGRDCIEFYGS